VRKLIKTIAAIAATAFISISLAACAPATSNEITVVVHDSVVISDELLASFKKQTGIEVTLIKAGDTGSMTNKLVLTKDEPLGDAVYGIDNTFASLATKNGVIDGDLTAIDYGDVCMNYDKIWFSTNEQAAPTSINDLIKPEFDGLSVIENPTTSSVGLAFLTATISVFGDSDWQGYWTSLKKNNVKVVASWEDAYYTHFSGSSGKGKYPIVLSYSSSPAYEIRDNGESQTEALLDALTKMEDDPKVRVAILTGASVARLVDDI
jgi:thiamine transport system substrate-binding protein